jgi:purine-cytosine permease-like protein
MRVLHDNVQPTPLEWYVDFYFSTTLKIITARNGRTEHAAEENKNGGLTYFMYVLTCCALYESGITPPIVGQLKFRSFIVYLCSFNCILLLLLLTFSYFIYPYDFKQTVCVGNHCSGGGKFIYK